MFAIIWRALIFLTTLWFVQRLLGVLLGTGGKRQVRKGPETRPDTNHMVKDPVCGMYLDYRLAIPLENKSGTFYFCSKECKSKYLANPV